MRARLVRWFALLALTLLGQCPLALGLPALARAERGFFEPCLGTNLGLFRGEGVEGSGVTDQTSASVFWRDVLLVGRMGATLGGGCAANACVDNECTQVCPIGPMCDTSNDCPSELPDNACTQGPWECIDGTCSRMLDDCAPD